MDAGAFLRKQGWKGTGHSLDGHGRGIKKPLLIAHKQDQLGLGLKKAAHAVDDQWWMRAFDETLQNLGTGKQSTLNQVRTKGVSRGGLYGFFVRGEGLAGTITSSSENSGAEETSSAPLSGASTPPTSSSEHETTAKPTDDTNTTTMAPKNNKRKRETDDGNVPHKKLKEQAEYKPTSISTPLGVVSETELPRLQTLVNTITKNARSTAKKLSKQGKIGITFPKDLDKGKKKDEVHRRFTDPTTGKSMTVKEAKYENEKALRDAAREHEKLLAVDALLRGALPNPHAWTRDQALEHSAQIARTVELVRDAATRLEAARKAQQKLAKRAEKEAQHLAARQAKEARLAARQADAASAAAAQDALIEAKVGALDPAKRAEYEARAAEKAQTLQQYVARRIAKKDEKRTAKDAAHEMAAAPANALFVVDVQGDRSLLTATQAPAYTPLPDGSCPLDPSLWEGRVVKELPKEVRRARAKWMAERRAARKEKTAKGGKTAKGKEGKAAEGLSRVQKKMEQRAVLTKKILLEQGVKKGASKEERNLARRKAGKIMKLEKRERERGQRGRGANAWNGERER